jgi:hypothetical protein
VIDAFAELTLETRDPALLESFCRGAFGFEVLSRGDDRVCERFARHAGRPGGAAARARVRRRAGEHPGGDRLIYIEDPEGNVVEVWDFFRHGDGARDDVDALR